jgi:F0F1-type ATP synthase assembly protein I
MQRSDGHDRKQSKDSPGPAPLTDWSRKLAIGSDLAMALPGGVFGGWLVGSFLDAKWHTHWITIAGILLGMIGGFVHIIRVAFHGFKD